MVKLKKQGGICMLTIARTLNIVEVNWMRYNSMGQSMIMINRKGPLRSRSFRKGMECLQFFAAPLCDPLRASRLRW